MTMHGYSLRFEKDEEFHEEFAPVYGPIPRTGEIVTHENRRWIVREVRYTLVDSVELSGIEVSCTLDTESQDN